LELVPGQTLAETLKAGPLSVEDAMKVAVQIAEALDAAHEKGVVHRDLKPSNVMLTEQGERVAEKFEESIESLGESVLRNMAAEKREQTKELLESVLWALSKEKLKEF
ncbi:MAG: protein kinase, partial [Fidelibacterota bacterium]